MDKKNPPEISSYFVPTPIYFCWLRSVFSDRPFCTQSLSEVGHERSLSVSCCSPPHVSRGLGALQEPRKYTMLEVDYVLRKLLVLFNIFSKNIYITNVAIGVTIILVIILIILIYYLLLTYYILIIIHFIVCVIFTKMA